MKKKFRIIRYIEAKERDEYAYLGDAFVFDGSSFEDKDVIAAGLRAANADRSNPFAYARALSEMRYGHKSPNDF